VGYGACQELVCAVVQTREGTVIYSIEEINFFSMGQDTYRMSGARGVLSLSGQVGAGGPGTKLQPQSSGELHLC
jgi:hypothetical protein